MVYEAFPDAQWLESRCDFFSFLCHFRCRFKKMYKYAKFDQNIWCSSGVVSIFTDIPQLANMMLDNASSLFCIPVSGQC